MNKLYSVLDQISTESAGAQDDEIKLNAATDQVSEMVDIMSADLENTIELTNVAAEHMEVAESIHASLESLSLGSKEYFACLENHKSVLGIISRRMGVLHLPAMEDFKNEYSLKASHQISLESVSDFWKRSWEAIKKFFKEFFKKVMVFLKRILHANLDLESYEKYTEQLIAKMKNLKPELTDNTPISSKLGIHLADKGQEMVDSDYILRTGMRKVINVVEVINAISRTDGYFLDTKKLKNFRELLEKVVKIYNVKLNHEVNEHIDNHLTIIRDNAANLLTSMFKYSLPNVKSLPNSVYEKLFDDFTTSDLSSGDINVMSLIPVEGSMNTLPRDINLFLARQGNDKFFVSGYKEENGFTKPEVKPISNFRNLTMFHDDYKKHIKTADVSGCVKAIDAAEDEIFKILDILSGKYITLMDKASTEILGNETFYVNLVSVMRDRGADVYDFMNNNNSIQGDLRNRLIAIYGLTDPTNSPEDIIRSIEISSRYKPELTEEAIRYISKDLNIDIKALMGEKYDEHTVSNYKKFQELNAYLTHIFNKLQIIFRMIASDVFGAYTEIRYELVRYIYESCRRYSY